MNAILLRRLTEARHRLIVEDFLRIFPWLLLGTLIALALGRGLSVILFQPWSWPLTAAIVVGLPLVVAMALAGLRWRKAEVIAREIDRRLPVHDRFSTGLQLTGDRAFDQLARREIFTFAEGQTMSSLCAWKFPKSVAWIVLPLTALILIEILAERHAEARRPEIAQARQMVDAAAKVAAEQAKKDPVLEEIARELDEAAKKLATSSEPLRDALRSLDEAQQRAKAAANNKALDAAESAALAEAFAKSNPQLSENLHTGNSAESAAQIANLDPEALAQALKDAASHTESSRLREMSRMAAGQAKKQMMSTFSKGNSSGQKKFVSMVDDIKNGTSSSKDDPGQGKGGEKNDNSSGQDQTAQSSSEDKGKTGSPGSEKDLGKGKELTETGQARENPAANDDFIAGVQGEGPSLVELYRQAGNDDAKAQRAYKAAYGAAAAALDAAEHEEIPMGSRILIRRYFEAIRPPE